MNEKTTTSRLSRDELRTKIFADNTLKRETITFSGIEMELRQPMVGDVLDRDEGGNILIDVILIQHCYVPGTNELVFEEADRDSIRAMPFNAELTDIITKFNELSGMGVKALKEAEGES